MRRKPVEDWGWGRKQKRLTLEQELAEQLQTCPQCKGLGEIHIQVYSGSPLDLQESVQVCDKCHGFGDIPKEKKNAP